MPAGVRPIRPDYDPDFDPELGDALQRFYAQNPAVIPDISVRKAAPTGPADLGGITVRRGAPPPMTQPMAALQSMTDGAAPTRAEQIAAATGDPAKLDALLTPGFKPVGRSTGTVTSDTLDVPPTPQGQALFSDLQAAGRREADTETNQPLPDVAMPLPGEAQPAKVPGLIPPSVRVRQAAHVDVPNTAVVQSQAPREGPLPADHPAVAKALESARSKVKVAPDTAGGDLEAALQQSRDRRLVAGLTRAGGAMVGRGSGPGYDALDAEADRPIQELQLRRADATQAKARADAAAEDDPSSPQSRQARDILSKMAPDLAKEPSFAGLTAARAKTVFPWAKELFEAASKKDIEGMKVQGEIDKVKAKHAGGGGAGAGLSKEAAKELAVLQRQWDPSGPRSGERGKNQARVNAAGRIEALANGPGGQPADLNPQQMTELARQLDTLLSNGGQATEGITRALAAHTASGRVADMLQWLTSEPHGAGQRAFVQQMLETARREKEVAGRQLQDSYISTLPGVPTLLRERPDVIQNMLRANGVDPEGLDLSTGLRRAPAASPALAPVASGAPRKQYSPSRNQTRLIYPDGRVEVHDGRL